MGNMGVGDIVGNVDVRNIGMGNADMGNIDMSRMSNMDAGRIDMRNMGTANTGRRRNFCQRHGANVEVHGFFRDIYRVDNSSRKHTVLYRNIKRTDQSLPAGQSVSNR